MISFGEQYYYDTGVGDKNCLPHLCRLSEVFETALSSMGFPQEFATGKDGIFLFRIALCFGFLWYPFVRFGLVDVLLLFFFSESEGVQFFLSPEVLAP